MDLVNEPGTPPSRHAERLYLGGRSPNVRFLITGAAGFIGTSMVHRLAERGDEIHAVDRRVPREPVFGVQYSQIDLVSRSAVQRLVDVAKPEVILHFAAQSRVEPSFLDPSGTFDDNVLSTLNLVHAVKSSSRRTRLVFASSEAVYGPAEAYPTPEGTPLRPQSAYAASKAAAELVVRHGLPRQHVILRSGMGFGPRSDPSQQVVARFLTRAMKGQSLRFPAGTNEARHPTRDINYVENFVDGAILAAEARVSDTFNIATGVETSTLELAKAVISVAGSGRIEHDSAFQYRQGEEGLRICLDIAKARDVLGYRPLVSLVDGLRRTAAWLASNPEYWSTEPQGVQAVVPLQTGGV